MRGMVLLLAALTSLLVAPVAAAQQGSPIKGGGSFTEAPMVEPGGYSDSIRMSEELFYAVELTEGQALKISAKLRGQSNVGFDSFGIGQLQVYNSLRDRWPTNALEGFDGAGDSAKWSLKTVKVGDELGPDAEFFAQPGTYYFSLRFTRNVGTERQSPIFKADGRYDEQSEAYAITVGILDAFYRKVLEAGALPIKREFESRLNVKVIGQPATPSPTPTEATEPAPEDTSNSGAAAPPSDTTGSEGDTPYLRVFLMTFLIGLLLGFGIVAIKGFSGRRPPPATERSA